MKKTGNNLSKFSKVNNYCLAVQYVIFLFLRALKELNRGNKWFQDTMGSKERRLDRLLRTTVFHVYDPKLLTATAVLDLAATGTASISSHLCKTKHRGLRLQRGATLSHFCFTGMNECSLSVKTGKYESQRTWAVLRHISIRRVKTEN